MNKKGFTLIELLMVVLIVGTLTAVALPEYYRSAEKARATEAMEAVKHLNDAVYAYAAEHSACPTAFKKLLMTMPGTAISDTKVQAKYFTYTLNAATNAKVPGTACGGIVAERNDGTYKIWNPYQIVNADTKARTLACTGDEGICKALGVYTTNSPS